MELLLIKLLWAELAIVVIAVICIALHQITIENKVSEMNRSSIKELENTIELTKLVKSLEQRINNLPAELREQLDREEKC